MGEKRFIDLARILSKEEAREIISKISERPAALALVKLFQRASDEDSYRKTEVNPFEIYSSPKDKTVLVSMQLEHRNESTLLSIFPCTLERLAHTSERAGYYELARIYAGPRETGVWCYGRGNQTAYGIEVRVRPTLLLPSKQVQWLFSQLSWFSTICGEYCLNTSEQEKFWTGDKENPQ